MSGLHGGERLRLKTTRYAHHGKILKYKTLSKYDIYNRLKLNLEKSKEKKKVFLAIVSI
jgi:hypothetical protein